MLSFQHVGNKSHRGGRLRASFCAKSLKPEVGFAAADLAEAEGFQWPLEARGCCAGRPEAGPGAR